MLKLTSGDRVAVVAPSGNVDKDFLFKGIEVLSSCGLIVEKGEFILDRSGYFASSHENRKSDLQLALDNPKIKAVFCARGGYGLSRIIDQMNWEGFNNYPKWIIGFSDITMLHLELTKRGYPSIHGPMVVQYGKDEYKPSFDALKKLLFNGSVEIQLKEVPQNFPRNGVVVGGNLRIIIDSIGTKSQPDFTNKVLFIEEIGEHIYKIDRMIVHLERLGILSQIKGIIIGHFTSIYDTEPSFEGSALEIIQEMASRYNIPIIDTFPAGHEPPNMPIMMNNPFSIIEKDGSFNFISSL